MRLGMYGGSFDPVHYGHLLLAQTAHQQARLDKVWFMPAAESPHKQGQSVAPTAARIEMLRLAIAGNAHFDLSLLECERGGVSYTLETLQMIAQQEPDAERFLIMGADSLVDFPNWKSPGEICQLATLLVVARPGVAVDFGPPAPLVSPEQLSEYQEQQLQMPLVGFSSSELRTRVAEGKSIRYWTPRSVEKVIETQGLYRAGE